MLSIRFEVMDVKNSGVRGTRGPGLHHLLEIYVYFLYNTIVANCYFCGRLYEQTNTNKQHTL